jgi:hypothetical protein
MSNEPNYYWQHMDEKNIRDLLGSISRQEVVALVSEREGGIVGYLIYSSELSDFMLELKGEL